MDLNSEESGAFAPTRGHAVLWPVATFMILALIVTLGMLVDWTGNGQSRGFLIFLPAFCGLVGSILAVVSQRASLGVRLAWSCASLAWGALIVPATMIIVLIISGP